MNLLFRFVLSLLAMMPLMSFASLDGAQLYETHCAACHQVNGGGIGLPLSLSKLDNVADDYIRLTIRNGRPGRIMPAFEDLSEAQVNAITAYIRSWSGNPGPRYADDLVSGDGERGS